MRRSLAVVILLSCAIAAGGVRPAIADITRFSLSGTVADTSGGVLPGATVTLTNVDTGFSRSVVTDQEGRYLFAALPPTGRWSVTVELPGFQTQLREGLRFQANTSPEINVELGVGGLEEVLVVEGSAPLISTRESERSAVLDDRSVSQLPTSGRSFLSLLQTSGSVVPTGGGSGNLSLNGQGIRMTNFLADGVSMSGREIRTLNGEFGGGNGLSLEVIRELQVITDGFKAETGQTGAGAVSIVTKSGTNTFDGSLFGYWRPTRFVAANQLTGLSTTQERQQYGATSGGPIVRDRTHYFANWESTIIDDEVVVTSVLDPGTFERPQRQHQLFSKVNHRFSDRHLLDARFNLNRNTQENNGVGGLNTFERRSNTEGRTDTFVTSLVSTIGNNKVNEARFRYTFDTVDFYSPLTAPDGRASRTPDFSNVPVAINRPGVGNAGANPGLPQNLVEKRAQFVEHFSITSGSHQWKLGADVLASWRFVTFFNNFTGSYTFAPGTPFPFDPVNPATTPFQYTQNFGASGLRFTDTMVGLFVQDDWELRRGLTLNLGVRWDKDSLFQGDNNNFAPRLGFVWNVGNAGRTVVRANSGIFYDTLESSLVNRESNFGPVGQDSIDLRAGDPLFPSFPSRFSSFPAGAAAVPRATVYVPVFKGDDFPFSIGDRVQRSTPYFFNSSVGVQRQLSTDWALSLDYTRVRGYDLLVTFDVNAPPFFEIGPGRTRTAAQANAQRPLGVPNTTGGPLGVEFTGFRSLYLQFNGGETQYDAVKIGLIKRYANRYMMQANYTYGKARGTVDNFRLTGSFVPGLRDIGGERGYQQARSDTDTPHVFALSGLYEVIWGIRVGGILFARSGFPYTGVAGFDADGDGFSSTSSYGDRPAGLQRNSFQRPAFATLDLSLAKTVRLAGDHQIEARFDVFNVTNRMNITGVNNVIGLDAANPPATFGSTTGVGEQRQAQFALRYSF
jgi:outer membrane receptor protein involved in Fe transport